MATWNAYFFNFTLFSRYSLVLAKQTYLCLGAHAQARYTVVCLCVCLCRLLQLLKEQ